MEHVEVNAGSCVINFYVYSASPADAAARLSGLQPLFARMPAAHQTCVYPIFVVDRLPGGRGRGGGNYPPHQASQWLRHESVTGVSDEDVRNFALNLSTGIIGVTAAALADEGRAHGIYKLTVFHEVGHCVDDRLGLVAPGVTVDDLQGQIYPTRNVRELAVEAYSRWIVNPHRLCRQEAMPAGESQANCRRRIMAVLARSRAFAGVPLD
jgi:hypothetical protein